MSNPGDIRTRFLLPRAGVRGICVRLQDTWRDILSHAEYPDIARGMLGQSCAAAALFTGHAKVNGRLSLQLRSRHAGLRTLFAECTAQSTLRGIAQVAEGRDAPSDLHQLGDDALLAITIENPGLDPREPQRYQSLVPLQAATLSAALEGYFQQSEQLPTRLLLAADGARAAGLMLQKLPATTATTTAGTASAPCSTRSGPANCLPCLPESCCTGCFMRKARKSWPSALCASPVHVRVSGSARCSTPWA